MWGLSLSIDSFGLVSTRLGQTRLPETAKSATIVEGMETSEMLDSGLSELTRGWMAGVSVEGRKRLGQYMTPGGLREKLLDRCELFEGMRVLDPGVGTGEFLRSVAEREPLAEMHGWDVDGKLLEVASANAPEAHLAERSALDVYDGEPFDLVIGNPPYFQFKPSCGIRDRFAGVISGRVNIFALFFQAGLEALRPGGQLAYVVPPSMNTGAYFERLRQYLLERSEIEFLEIHHDQKLFDGAQTPVQLIVLRRADTAKALNLSQLGKHSFIRESLGFRRTIFAENPSDLKAALQGRSSLFELGYEAVTGTIVWNQHRSDLRHEATNGEVPLIWAQNIGNGKLLNSENCRRPKFIDTDKPTMTGPAIVANRITGAVGDSRIRYALVPEGNKFLAENHVNVIRLHARFEPKANWRELLLRLKSHETNKNLNFVSNNTQISATEMTHLVPV